METYIESTSITEKKEIARGIMNTVQLGGGRFLLRNRMDGGYDILEDHEATACTIQHFQDRIRARRPWAVKVKSNQIESNQIHNL